jgi:DNA helicase-2/ATP-dependent DNA helicase PcrA
MDNLNEYQIKAAEYNGKHLLVLAGAGTGKTKTIIARAEYLLNSGIQPNKIAILSFTRKSAKEIAERLKISVSSNINKNAITGKTFHSWCNEIMRFYPDYFPHHNYTPLDEDDRLSAVALAVGRNFKDSQNEKVKKDTVVAIYSYAINTLCSLSDAIFHIRYCNADKDDEQIKKYVEQDKNLIAPVIKKYIDYKKERRYIDYDDMLSVVADVLEKNREVRNAVSSRYEYVLIDEMQDTNPLQYKLMKSFIDKSHLFCVGDDAQSIYAFRGADFKTIHSFTDIFPNSETYKLLLNYRSTQEILDLSNWVLEQSPLNYDKKLIANKGNGEKPNLIHVEDDWEEADIITDDILKCVSEGGKYNDTLVLGRSGWSLSKVEGACLKKKIPYIKLGGTSLMQSAHVRDVASAMRIVANNYDEIAWIRYLQLWDGIGEIKAAKIISNIIILDTLEKMLDYLQHSNIKEVIEDIPNTLKNVQNFINRPAQAMKEALDSMQKILEKKYKDEWKYRIADFEVLEEVAKSAGSITEFITEYVLDPKAETTFKMGRESNTDVVTLSTIHSAKGLESKTVHIINVSPYNYPSTRTIKQGKDAIEEERRCLYVALTRAKERLNLYRLSHSIHTQFDDQIKGEYISDENKKVYALRQENIDKVIYVSFIDNDNKVVQKLILKDFFEKYSKAETNEEDLYFLNTLPSNLVKIVVTGQAKSDFPYNDSAIRAEAEFPCFDFE